MGYFVVGAVVAAVLVYELACLVVKPLDLTEGSRMTYVLHPLASFRKLSKKKKALSLSGLAFFALAGTALAFYLLSLTGSGSGSIGINGAQQASLGNDAVRVVLKSPGSCTLEDGTVQNPCQTIDIGGTVDAGVWLAQNASPLTEGSNYQITGVKTGTIQIDNASGQPDSSCQASWFSVGNWTPNPLWATDGSASDGAGTGTQWPEVFTINDNATNSLGTAGPAGQNGSWTGSAFAGFAWNATGTNPDGAIGVADSGLDPTKAADAASTFPTLSGVTNSSDYEIATTTVSFNNSSSADQNACDGDTLTIPVTLGS